MKEKDFKKKVKRYEKAIIDGMIDVEQPMTDDQMLMLRIVLVLLLDCEDAGYG